MKTVTIVGAGLAGCEAALQCAKRGVPVRLFEMRPGKMTEAHETGDVAELVCSNSLKSDEPENAHGLLKAELRIFGSVLLECAERARVPGGKALVVDRRRFSVEVQFEFSRAGVSIERAEVSSLPPLAAWYRSRAELSDPHQPTVALSRQAEPAAPVTVIATGPLTSPSLAEALQALLGAENLSFYDAIAPIVAAESLDMSRVFEGSRYGAGSDYLNCPMDEEEYGRFVDALLGAELHPIHEFENPEGEHPQITQITQMSRQHLRTPQQEPGTKDEEPGTFFEGCLPVEEIARRGRLALAFGPMKPVGLVDPRTGKRPFAVVQLRRENAEGTMYNLVGFQTRLKQGEQQRVFRMIPGLAKVAFLRFGSIHRNTFLDSPKVLLPTLQTRASPDLLVAGQLAGVEGYVESIGAGLVAGINAARLAGGGEPTVLPDDTMLGSLIRYITASASDSSLECGSAAPALALPPGKAAASLPHSKAFQPMNANYGLLPPLAERLRGRDKRRAMAERALSAARGFALTVAENRA
ncbi:MAG: methylenetetrahydrofolate--tRNA-(uracil(54)-C(5))-methyltransferase (FADH(2)-oxidizing) TrmFO [candidate division WOR-3 bacterium]|nr:methylenetetrahydrofolate--tRNA-(uracil(54)-C(5))-methyltransferase (FADH(2)-oxidizing) TrmFO [candidate division WOR-3 bacterium]